jgi:hypothetical protein
MQSTIRNLNSTISTIKIIDDALKKGYLNYYTSIKRRYLARKLAHEVKIQKLRSKSTYVCTIKFFFYWLLKMIIGYSSANNDEICNDLDILMIEEYITYQNKKFFNLSD